MPHAHYFKPAALALLAILSFGCNKNHDETRSSSTSAADAHVNVEIVDFPTLDAKSWVNGTPVSLAEARGKHVVLIEAWHPA